MPGEIELIVNGQTHTLEIDSTRDLLSVLRNDLGLTGTKYGCGEGQCGACTVLVAGVVKKACMTPVMTVIGKPITTIEGLEKDGQLHPVQQAFLDEEAMQCGFCTPGMILSSVALLKKNPNPSREQVIQAMQGNICRCGTYSRILAAIRRAAETMKEAGQ